MSAHRLFSIMRAHLAAGFVVAMSAFPAHAEPIGSFDDWVNNGQALLDVRYRYEDVDDAAFAETAQASTIRTRLGYQTAKWDGWQFLIELEDTHAAGQTDYNTPGPDGPSKPQFPVIADPIFAELNRAWLSWGDPGRFLAKGGRQRVILDNARWVGNVGWRQNEQTFDALTVMGHVGDNLDLFGSYFVRANTVTHTNRDMDSPMLHAKWGTRYGDLTGYAYFLDFDPGAGVDSQSWGLRWNGRVDFGTQEENRFDYTLEWARQSDYSDASDFSADYYHLTGTVDLGGFFAGLGYEVLSSDHGSAALQTPLATLHAFNGWADVFLATPAAGLEDGYLTAGFVSGKWKLWGIYHNFDPDSGSGSYGDEFDAALTFKPARRWTLGANFADYSSDAAVIGAASLTRDVRKFWVWAGFVL